MADRLIHSDTDKRIFVVTEATDTDPQVERYEWRRQNDQTLSGAIATLRQWADDAGAVTVTSTNHAQVTQVLVDRLGIFFDRFADLLENEYHA